MRISDWSSDVCSSDLRRVAEEKSGIVKPGSTFVLGETDPALADVFADTPAAETWRRDVDFGCTANRLAVGGRLLDLRTPGASYDDVFLDLHGPHTSEERRGGKEGVSTCRTRGA